MDVDDDDSDVPETGAVFTFGKCKFNDNIPGKFWLRDDKVQWVSCGDEHTVIVAESGKVFTFGDNSWGQLGLGHNNAVSKPTRIKALAEEKVTLAACGTSHTLLVTESGNLYGFGASGEGQLGFDAGKQDRISVPTKFPLPNVTDRVKVRQLCAGGYHSACLTDAGEVFVWGMGSEGQLGHGRDVDKLLSPTHLPFDEKIVEISCGYYHTCFVTDGGVLYGCGETESGKLGFADDAEIDNFVPNVISGVTGRTIHVSCGHNHTVAVTDQGEVFVFGDGSNGQLGCGNMCLETSTPQLLMWSSPTKILRVSCGEGHTAFISDNGVLYTCGDGRHGKLALGDANLANQFRPAPVLRFNQFFVEKVFCGGCHTVVVARPRVADDNVALMSHDESVRESSEEPASNKLSYVSEMIRRGEISNSLDMTGSLSARIRRRQKSPNVEDSPIPLPRLSLQELPPLRGSGDQLLTTAAKIERRTKLDSLSGNNLQNRDEHETEEKMENGETAKPLPKPRLNQPASAPTTSLQSTINNIPEAEHEGDTDHDSAVDSEPEHDERTENVAAVEVATFSAAVEPVEKPVEKPVDNNESKEKSKKKSRVGFLRRKKSTPDDDDGSKKNKKKQETLIEDDSMNQNGDEKPNKNGTAGITDDEQLHDDRIEEATKSGGRKSLFNRKKTQSKSNGKKSSDTNDVVPSKSNEVDHDDEASEDEANSVKDDVNTAARTNEQGNDTETNVKQAVDEQVKSDDDKSAKGTQESKPEEKKKSRFCVLL